MDLRDKKVLLQGLGILGGGVATARFLVEQGAQLTVTDMKTEEFLEPSLEKLKDLKISYVLGEHREEDFLNTDILVINPDVPSDNKFVELVRKAGKPIENELTLFYKFAPCKTIVGITGTRGKTTTTNWIGHILKHSGQNAKVIGNDPQKPFLSEIKNCTEDTIAILETPSFQLEIFGESGMAPHVAVITNLYQDHLSRHKTMEGYALVKANIFKNQTEKDFLILDNENSWTEFFLKQNPKAKVVFPSSLPSFDSDKFSEKYGEHNLKNFLIAAAAAKTIGISEVQILSSIDTLPQIKWRQELIYESLKLNIYNDTAATSPEASIAAVKRFSRDKKMVLICGGTDRELDFREWGKFMNENLTSENMILLSGSATLKMKTELAFSPEEYDSLEECLQTALSRVSGKSNIVFSPGAKSFEKFKNEFDRGEKFNEVVYKLL